MRILRFINGNESIFTAGALMAYERNKTASLRKTIGHGLWAFFAAIYCVAGF